MNTKEQKAIEVLNTVVSGIDWSDAVGKIRAILHPPKRNHNTLEVNENTPEGTLVQVRDADTCKWRLRIFSHMDNGRYHVFHYGYQKGDTVGYKYARLYIGQHFIPWDAKQSDGTPPCEGRVRLFFSGGGGYTLEDAISYVWKDKVIGYLPITDTGETDWERVPG